MARLTLYAVLLTFVSFLVLIDSADVGRPRQRRPCGANCYAYCPCGNVSDREGCPTCMCKQCGPQLCPVPNCVGSRGCRYGRKTTVYGCQTCDCNPAPICGQIACHIRCDHGYKYVDGCQTCDCNPAPWSCPNVHCGNRRPCRYGRKIVNGCQTCDCNPAPICGQIACHIGCEHGYKYVDGCQICDCNPAPWSCPNVHCGNRRPCRYGRKIVNGCQTCDCNPAPWSCPNVVCGKTRPCRYGRKIVNGCQTCDCNPGPSCGQFRCRGRCLNGYRIVNGCHSCLCNARTPQRRG